MSTMKKALLLGMVYSEEMEPKRGQEYRDRVRCEALENSGYEVYTLDNKHKEESAYAGKHCQANFADTRRMIKSIGQAWGEDICFDVIILDYFFCPVGWARERWGAKFFRDSIPLFAEEGILKPNGSIWLPYLECVEHSLQVYRKQLLPYFSYKLISNPLRNPLYAATESVEEQLTRCPDLLTNETQIAPLDEYSDTPFCQLKRIKATPEVKNNSKVTSEADTPTRVTRQQKRYLEETTKTKLVYN